VEFLPTPDQQAWLIEALAEIIRNRGSRQFLSMPLLEPTPRFFPDPWSFSPEGLDRVVRRLMQYADLGELDVNVGTFSDPGLAVADRGFRHSRSVAGAFLGLREGCAYFAINDAAPADSSAMAGLMSHEVAHAYRAFHHLSDVSDPDEEEWLTDVTAAYLGFGILVANASYLYRKAPSGKRLSSYQTSVHQLGYLSPQAFAFLLAIQMEARGLGDRQEELLLKFLEANQSAFVKAAIASMADWSDETLGRLAFSAEGVEIPQVSLEEIQVPLPEFEVVAHDEEPPESTRTPPPGPNAGRPVFRLRQTRLQANSAVGLIAGIAVGASSAVLLHQPLLIAVIPILGFTVGAVRGQRKRYDVCSDRDCDSVLESDAQICPGCGGLIAGSIRRRDDRLAAEEEFERTHARPKRNGGQKRR